jgi:hypothetical protein
MGIHRGAPTAHRVLTLLCLLVAACGGPVLDVDVEARYREVRSNLLTKHLVNGVVVSLGHGEKQPNNRDALLHTSLTMAALPCADASRLLAGIASLELAPGRYVRYYDYPKSDQISRDMIIGLVFGLAQKYRECPALRPEIKRRMSRLLSYVEKNDGSLGIGPASDLTPASRAAVHFAGKIIEVHEGPTAFDRGVLIFQASTLPVAVMGSGVQFYAVHLTALELLLWTWAGPNNLELRSAQWAFCNMTAGFRNALYDGLCGRPGNVEDSLRQWTYSCMVYRWQVANPWSNCKPRGEEHPGHDFLILYQLYVRAGMLGDFVPKVKAGGWEAPLTPVEEALSLWPEQPVLEWAW